MLLTKETETTWHYSNKEWFESKGFKFTKYGDIIRVKIEDLPEGSSASVEVLCDYCMENIIPKQYKTYINQNKKSNIQKDCCRECFSLKVVESNLIKYGVGNLFQLDEIKEKSKQTNINKLGVAFPMQSEQVMGKSKQTCLEKYNTERPSQSYIIHQKMEETMLDRYGVKNYAQTEDYQIKYKNTHLERYGVENPMFSEMIKKKVRDTNLKRYGFSNPSQNLDILTKQRKSLYENGNTPTSAQQKYLHCVLNGELNYPVGNCNIDIAFINEKIALEVDCSGHNLEVLHGQITQEEFDKKHVRRSYFLMRQGWREIRIISIKDRLPSDSTIISMIDYAKQYLNSGHHWLKFDIDNSKVITSQFEKDYDFGKLRKITKKDLERFEKNEEPVLTS